MPRNQSQGQTGQVGRGGNLSDEARRKGGEESANMQERDEQGQFMGSEEEGRERSRRGSNTGNRGGSSGGRRSDEDLGRD